MRKLSQIALILSVFVAFTAQAQVVKLAAGASAMPLINKLTLAFKRTTGLGISVFEVGVDVNFRAVDKGGVDAGISSISETDWIKVVKDSGYTADLQQFHFKEVGSVSLAFFVSKDLASQGVKKLSKQQAHDIFAGQLKNWKSVGGPDLPIHLVFNARSPGFQKEIAVHIMDNAPFYRQPSDNFMSTAEMLDAVAHTPGAIGFTSLNQLTASTSALSEPRVKIPMNVLTKGEPSANVQKLIDFLLSTDGQKFLKD